MATRFSELIVKISALTSDFDKQIGKVAKTMSGLGDSLTSIGTRMSVAITAPLAALGAVSIQSAANMDSLTRGMVAVTGSAEAAAREMNRLKEIAKLPGLGFKEAIEGAINLRAIGFSAERTQEVLSTFGNALATVGRGKADLDEVIRQLGQLASRGKVTADNLKPIIERVPQVAAVIKREFGTIDTEALQKLGISSEVLIDTLLRELGKLPKVTGGLKNELENLSDQIDLTTAAIGTALTPALISALKAMDPLIKQVGVLAQGFAKLPEPVQTASVAMVTAFALAGPVIAGLGATIKGVGQLADLLKKLGGAAGVTAGAIRAFAAVISPVGIVLTTLALNVGKIIDAWKRLRNEWENDPFLLRLRDRWKDMETGIAANLDRLRAVPPAFALVASGGQGVAAQIKAATGAMDEHAAAVEPVKVQYSGLTETMSKLEEQQRRSIELTETMNRLWGRTSPMPDVPVVDLNPQKVQDAASAVIESITKVAAAATEAAGAAGEMQVALDEALTKAGGNRTARNAELTIGGIRDELKKSGKQAEDFKREMDRAFDGIARGISKNILDFKGFGATLKSVARETAEGMLEIFLQRLLSPLKNAFANLIGGLADSIAGSIGGLFGNSALGSVFKGGSSAASGASGAASAAAGVASGITGVLGAVGSIGSLVTGIIGNFQAARQETTLNAIEHEVRYSQIHLSYLLEKANEFWPRVDITNALLGDIRDKSLEIQDRLWTIINQGISVRGGAAAASGGGGEISIDFGPIYLDGAKVAEAIVRRVKLAGA